METLEDKKLREGHRQRLKERFLKDEGKSMPEYELLELMLTYALPRKDTKPLAKKLIAKFGSLPKVIFAPQERLEEYGLSQHIIAFFKTYVALSHATHWHTLKESDEIVFKNMDFVLNYCIDRVAFLDHEEFRVIFLDAGLHLIDEKLLQQGTANCVVAHPTEVLKWALNYNATSVILYHNHPGGSLKASKEDTELTKEIITKLESNGIKVSDHLIITKDNYFSFQQSGLMDTLRKELKIDQLKK